MSTTEISQKKWRKQLKLHYYIEKSFFSNQLTLILIPIVDGIFLIMISLLLKFMPSLLVKRACFSLSFLRLVKKISTKKTLLSKRFNKKKQRSFDLCFLFLPAIDTMKINKGQSRKTDFIFFIFNSKRVSYIRYGRTMNKIINSIL